MYAELMSSMSVRGKYIFPVEVNYCKDTQPGHQQRPIINMRFFASAFDKLLKRM